MAKFLLGFLTALAIYQGPSIARRVFRDQPDYELRVGGSSAGTFRTLHDLEDYLDRLAVVKHGVTS